MRLEDLFSLVLEVPSDALSDDTGPANLKSWDSLRHIKLISAMEEVYGVTFSTAEIKSLKSMGAVRQALTGRGVAA